MSRAPNRTPLQSRPSTMNNITMQRRHFQLIAETMASVRPTVSPALDQWNVVVDALAARFSATNQGFNRDRFTAACQGQIAWEPA